MSADTMTTKELLARLRRHYIKPGARPPGGVFVPECGRNGSWGAARRCDALYVGFTSASGRTLVGHELKVSRADWRHELDQLDKADTWADACHSWYVVAPSTDIVPPEELPAGWGLMVPNPRTKTRMRVVQAGRARAPEDWSPPWWAVRSLMARLDTLQLQAMHEHEREAANRADAEARARYEARAEQSALTHAQVAALDRLARIEKAAGVTPEELDDYLGSGPSPQQLGAALRLVVAASKLPAGRFELSHLENLGKRVTKVAEELREPLAAWRELTGKGADAI